MTSKRGIVAMLLGLLMSVISSLALAFIYLRLHNIILPPGETIRIMPAFIMELFVFYLPVSIGGFITGYTARDDGSTYGLVNGIILWNILFIIRIFSGAFYGWQYWITQLLIFMAAGATCGYLGQLLAQKRHKRKYRQSSAPKGDD